ncbi:hypothetical protein ACOME3_005696 [Neoechinorhynchus agilis]
MPCHDKKLEAAKFKDIECVITTSELVELMHELNCPLIKEKRFPEAANTTEYMALAGGGYLENVKIRLLNENPMLKAEVEESREDWMQISLKENDRTAFRLAETECFTWSLLSNTRVLFRLKKRKGSGIDFIEVMACPGACLFGGNGQVRTDNKMLPLIHYYQDVISQCKTSSKHEILNEMRDEHLHTEYHTISHNKTIDW